MIKAFRADDRLIHGQVQTQWISTYGVDRVMIIDSNVVRDPINVQILKLAKPAGIDLVICDEEKAMNLIAKDAAQPAARTFVIFKTIETACRMQRRGLSIPSIIVGPCSSKAGAVQMGKNTYFTEKELAAADELTEHGTEIAFQLLPNEPKTLYRDVRKK